MLEMVSISRNLRWLDRIMFARLIARPVHWSTWIQDMKPPSCPYVHLLSDKGSPDVHMTPLTVQSHIDKNQYNKHPPS